MVTPDHFEDALTFAELRAWCASGEARAIRKAARLSLPETGRAVGASHSAIYAWETGKRKPITAASALRYHELLRILRDRTTGSTGVP